MALLNKGARQRGCRFGTSAHGGAWAPNVNDVTHAHAHGVETDGYADAGCQGSGRRGKTHDIAVNCHVPMRSGKRKVLDEGAPTDKLEQACVRIRANGEPSFRAMMRQSGQVKVRYRRLAKSTSRLHMLFTLSNLWMVRHTQLQEVRGSVRLYRPPEARESW